MMYCEPCPFCGESTYFDGQRRYWPEGFPYIHPCPPEPIKVPNERDFAPGGLYGPETTPAPQKPTPKRIAPVHPRIQQKNARPVGQGLDL